MRIDQHIKVGRMILENEVKSKEVFQNIRVNKVMYLIGCAAPDMNCVFPAHRLNKTRKRFYRRLTQVTRISRPDSLRSFELGVITHYVCDYFCYAHNNESTGAFHKKYEYSLDKFYRAHVRELEESSKCLVSEWLHTKKESMRGIIESDTTTSIEQCELIMEQVERMNRIYIREYGTSKKCGWYKSEEQMRHDMEYILFMSRHIVELVLQPVMCRAV